ncbi:MAG: SPOR domain-containing protein, partial [Bacteroidota bacterium]|nr:SPOR domain-containing protein [Bacteroidota bacterium]
GSGDSYNIQQTFSGSLGLDARSAKLSATNREQVGRAAVSVLMFIDKNGNRKYDDGEEKVPARALRLSESATFELGKDSILRITQLQSYWKYNAEIVQTALPNPTLAPLMSEFSFVADPNRYKRIEIPLYRTGVIEGKVNLRKGGIDAGQGGLRLLLKGVGHSFEETIHTFSDGGYYAMNLLPDKYTIEVDPTQLTFLNATSQPKQLEFEVKALAGGDYVEGLALLLIPKDTPSGTTPEFNRQKTEPAQPLVQQNETVPLNLWVQGKELKTDLLERVSGSCYYVQGGAFYTKPWADKFAAMLATKIPYPMVIMFEDKMYHVRFGYFKSRKAAKQCLEMVKKISPQSFLTFSNFGYYIMNLQPGRYSLEYDPAKLNFLSESSKPGRLEFEVKALTKGDYVNGSTLLLKPKDIQTGVSVPVTTPAVNPIKTEPVQPPVKQNMPAKQDESVKQNAKSKQNATSQQDIQVKQHVSVNQNIQRKEDIAVQQKAPVKQNISALHNVTIQGKEQETDSIGRLPGSYYVQGGAFYTKPWADKFAAMLATKIPYPVWVIFENRMYHVKFGYFSNKKTAKQCLEMVKKISPQSFLIMKDR